MENKCNPCGEFWYLLDKGCIFPLFWFFLIFPEIQWTNWMGHSTERIHLFTGRHWAVWKFFKLNKFIQCHPTLQLKPVQLSVLERRHDSGELLLVSSGPHPGPGDHPGVLQTCQVIHTSKTAQCHPQNSSQVGPVHQYWKDIQMFHDVIPIGVIWARSAPFTGQGSGTEAPRRSSSGMAAMWVSSTLSKYVYRRLSTSKQALCEQTLLRVLFWFDHSL